MRRTIAIALLTLLFGSLAIAADPCPITLLSGTGDTDAFSVTFRIRGKEPVRQLEFNCRQAGKRSASSQTSHCTERNSYFLPGNEYTVQYTYPAGRPGTVIVSLKTALFANGIAWKPKKTQDCRALTIQPRRSRKNAASG